ncbi:MAG: hypothetical protein FD119_2575 [Stygiobacter sp.]|nr:MAG: hypothetical protein FD119_2575 [Stygiobacter sp.]
MAKTTIKTKAVTATKPADSTTTAKIKTEPKPKAGRREQIKHQSYFAHVTDWRVSYGLMKGGDALHHAGPYWEHVKLVVIAEYFFPEKFAGQVAEISFHGERKADVELDHPTPEQFQPNRVGTIEVRKDRVTYYGTLPLSSLWGLLPAFAAGKIKAMRFHGVKRGEAAIWSMGFDHQIDPDEIG